MNRSHLFSSLQHHLQEGTSVALCTVIRTRGSVPRHSGTHMLVFPGGRIEGTIGGGEMEQRIIQRALELLPNGVPELITHTLSNPAHGDPGVCGGTAEIFVEPITPSPTLVIVGGGHVGAALVHLGRWLGFRIVLTDDRPEYCNQEAVPGADEYLPLSPDAFVERFPFHDQTYIVLPTRGIALDLQIIPLLVQQPHAYLGVIGSQKRWKTALDGMLAAGVDPEKLARIHAPMGLELGAETPEEIALSVLAEIIMLRRGGNGEAMKRKGSIQTIDS